MLASASTARSQILTGSGLDFFTDPADIDEATFKRDHRDLPPLDMAKELAEKKAQSVSERHPALIIIGADQTLECEGESFDKPSDMAAARNNLIRLRGKTHTLNSAVCLIQDNRTLCSIIDKAHMTMRDFDDAFLDEYLQKAGETVLTSVGCYRLEGIGAHLFSRIEGDFFTILGLPLLPVLSYLRDREFLH